ncbi:replication-associated recombination protein A [Candidatus Saccharibacteria bacterium]|nr:replication-associated recombination protein A [Candidatus Saccharibacteria bacterium]
MSSKPLAEIMRPDKLEDVVGQSHLIDSGQIIREIIKNKNPTSLILWGPPGSGKTTLARIIANQTDTDFIELSAVNSAKADVLKVIEHARQNQRLGQKTTLFIDEIHRFNKAQQDTFLPHIENGTITLIGATTENPSFEIINPLLSRSRVLVLNPLSKQEIITVLNRAVKGLGLSAKVIPKKSIALIAELSGGDARVALGNLELARQLSTAVISEETILNSIQKKLPGYDKNGDMHYDLISAFIKSMRGSDENATLYYLARILQGGEDPKFIARRMVIFASEDIGISAPAALNLSISTFQAVERIGMPECEYNLYHCAVVLARCKKSRAVTDAMFSAKELANKFSDLPVPLHLRNAPTKLMADLGYSKGVRWEANFKHPKGFLPEDIKNTNFF